MQKYNHIEINREDVVRQYKFPPNANAPKPPVRDRGVHGAQLNKELSQTMGTIKENRKDVGIQSENLLVIEIISDAMSPTVLENMLRKFNLYLVEETAIVGTNSTKLVIQFEDSTILDEFNYERELWQNDDKIESTLTYAQRRDLFNCIENIRSVSRQDRIGIRLQQYIDNPSLIPEGFFVVNIDVWFNGDRSTIIETESQLKQAMGTQGSKLLGDLFEVPSLLLGRASVNEFTLNALLDLDIIASVELPFSQVATEPYELYSWDFEPIIQNNLDDNAPLAAVLDSGIFTGNPLLNNIVVAEEDFDNTENTTMDRNGHGTGIAGIVAYGDFIEGMKSKIFKPLVRLCNGKIMHDENGNPTFPVNKRPEQVIKEAIEYFYNEYGCRVFNLSVGDIDHLYRGGRQFAWAEMLDQISLNLDVVIIVSAGNVPEPDLQRFTSRDELLEKCRDQLFDQKHRLIDPATSALSITVGSITRFDEPAATPNRSTRISVGKKNYMSVFTRIGRGVNKSIKPEVVDYGGNFAVTQLMRGETRWQKEDQKLLEPTLHNGNDKIFKGWCGTSFSAPHVTHIASRIERALETQLEDKPSANLIRALLVNSARCTDEMISWAESSKDESHTGKNNPKQERRLRLIGFGRADDSLLYSDDTQVTLFAEDKLELRSFHIYKIPVPKEFLKVKAEKSIAISLAYNPITCLSRKDYLTNNLWFEVFRKIDEKDLLLYKAKKESGEDTEEDLDNLPDKNKAAFFPGYRDLAKATLQQRIWKKGPRGGSDLLWDENEPYIYVMVTGKERFKYAEQGFTQSYALVVTFSYEGRDHIGLYTKLHDRVRIKTRQRTRTRTQIQR